VSVQWGTTAEQRSVAAPLSAIFEAVRDAGLETPLLTVIGEVGRLRESLSWFESQPLFGKRVLVTRTRDQASDLARLLRERGARPLGLPALELETGNEADIWASVRALGLGDYDWPVYQRQRVEHFFRHMAGVGWTRACSRLIAAIGQATARALRERSLAPDLVATESTSEGLLEALTEWARARRACDEGLQSARFLYPRAADARDSSRKAFAAPARRCEVVLYETRVPETAPADVLDITSKAAWTWSRSRPPQLSERGGASGTGLRALADCDRGLHGPVTAATARESSGSASRWSRPSTRSRLWSRRCATTFGLGETSGNELGPAPYIARWRSWCSAR
jgi:uroporphyrinogen-III synthase